MSLSPKWLRILTIQFGAVFCLAWLAPDTLVAQTSACDLNQDTSTNVADVQLGVNMTIGLVPIIGLPLPLMSYGGSSLVMTFLCLGLLMNVRMRRFKSGMFPS